MHERFFNLSADEKAEAIQRGQFTRNGVVFDFWRHGASGESWFRSIDEQPTPSPTSFPEIHGAPSVDTQFAADDDEAEGVDADEYLEWLLEGTDD